MAKILAVLPGMKALMAYLYHFLIMFEVLFILTLLETGTRVARFIVEEAIGQFRPGGSEKGTVPASAGGQPISPRSSWTLNITASLIVCFCWGGLLLTGNIDRLWRMMGIANQLLATIGLAVGTVYLLLHAPAPDVCSMHGDSTGAGGGERLCGGHAEHRRLARGDQATNSPVGGDAVRGWRFRGPPRAGLYPGTDSPDGGGHAGPFGGRGHRFAAGCITIPLASRPKDRASGLTGDNSVTRHEKAGMRSGSG